MYIHHFGLAELPFENVPDPKFFFDHGDHERVHNRIKDSLKAGRGLVVVTGPVGSGKTTLSQMIISEFIRDLKLIWMAEPPANSTDLFTFIAQELGTKPETTERTFLLRDIREALMKIVSAGSKCLVIIDEAHLMSDDTINGIRLLNNLEEGSTKLIQILLLGQEEIMQSINRPEMLPFKQRISALEILGRMNPDRVREYISHRLHVAGGQPSIFSETGWEAVLMASATGGGIPRVINTLCDRCLNAAYEKGKNAADVDDVYEVAEGMGISKDVFHYKVSLRTKEKEVVSPPVKEPPVKELPKQVEKPARRPVQKKLEPVTTFYRDTEEEKKSLKMPALVLLISIVVLIASFFYYCQRAESPDILTCLLDLLGL